MTGTDRFSGCRRDLLMELIATNFGTFDLFSSTLVTVYRTTGEMDGVLVSEGTASDWLRVFITTEATQPQACVTSRDALDEIHRKPDKTIAAAAS